MFVLFDRPLASFTNNIIFIDRPNNHKTRLGVICIIFCYLKITSFHTPHNNFKTLTLPYKLQGKNDNRVVSNARSIVVFQSIFLLLLVRFFSEKPTQAHTGGFALSKFYKKCADKWPLCKALYNIVLNQMSPRHISGILYESPQFTM